MLPTRPQDFHNVKPLFVLVQPIAIYPPQPFFYQQNLAPDHFLPSHRENVINSNHSLQCHKIEEISNYLSHEENIFFTLPQRKSNNEFEFNNNYIEPTNKINHINENRNGAKNIPTELSNTKIFPQQEKLSLEELRKPKQGKKRWTIEEDQLLFELKTNQYLNWRDIASKFPERTLKACQFRMTRLQCIKKKNSKREQQSLFYS